MVRYLVPMVPKVGIEPTRDFSQRILSPHRIPVPTLGHIPASFIKPGEHRSYFKWVPDNQRVSLLIHHGFIAISFSIHSDR